MEQCAKVRFLDSAIPNLQSSIQHQSGELAQLVERCDRTAEASGSSPLFSISQNS
jgi:hypothetical protein